MPSGVEHNIRIDRTGQIIDVESAPMPSGVEHRAIAIQFDRIPAVESAPMPSGVEHSTHAAACWMGLLR